MRSASTRQSALRANPGGALRRPWREADLAHGFGDLAHLLAAAPAMLDHALEEIGALFFPIDAGIGFLERGQHRILDAVGARGGETLDHHRLQSLDHHCLLYTSPSPRDRQKSRM